MEPEVRHKPVRYYEIDLLRFIAALAVVLYHFAFRGYYADHLSPVQYPVLESLAKYGYLGVELFFIISGYVVLMSAQGKTLSQFFTSRVMRLYPAYWVACTFTFVMIRLFGTHAPDVPVSSYLINMTMLHTFFGVAALDGVYWTLTIELIFYFLVALLISFKWLKHLPLVLAGWLTYCAVFGQGATVRPFSFLLFPNFAPFFIAGMTFYLLQTSQVARWKLYGLLAASYVLGLRAAQVELQEKVMAYHQSFSLLITLGLITLFFVVFLAVIFRWLRLGQAKWLGIVGSLTYPLYLLHHNSGYIILQRVAGHVDKYVLLFGMLGLFLVLAYALHRFVEQPVSKLLGQRIRQLLVKF